MVRLKVTVEGFVDIEDYGMSDLELEIWVREKISECLGHFIEGTEIIDGSYLKTDVTQQVPDGFEKEYNKPFVQYM